MGPRGFPGANTSPRFISGVLSVARLFVCIAALSAVVACAPVLKPAGPAIRTPAIADGNLIARDNERLPLTSWPARQSPDTVIIALHSFRDYHKAYDELGRWFAARGVSVYAYDQRGFGGAPNRGLWAGTETMVGDLRDAIIAVRAANPDTRVLLAGESMGAAVIMALMASPNPPPVAGIVLVAPAVRGKLVRNPFGDALLSLATITAPGNKTRVRQRPDPTLSAVASARLRDDPLVLRDVRVDTYAGLMALADVASISASRIDVPSLLLFGANDGSVTLASVCDAQTRIRQSLLSTVFYADGSHLLLQTLDNERAFTDIKAWMSGTPPPSLENENVATDLPRFCRTPHVAG